MEAGITLTYYELQCGTVKKRQRNQRCRRKLCIEQTAGFGSSIPRF